MFTVDLDYNQGLPTKSIDLVLLFQGERPRRGREQERDLSEMLVLSQSELQSRGVPNACRKRCYQARVVVKSLAGFDKNNLSLPQPLEAPELHEKQMEAVDSILEKFRQRELEVTKVCLRGVPGSGKTLVAAKATHLSKATISS